VKKFLLLNAFVIFAIITHNILGCHMPAYSLNELAHTLPSQNYSKPERTARIIHVLEGRRFTITLDCQPSTGYTWYITTPTLEDTIQLLGKTVMPCRCQGGKSKMTFIFQALKAGEEIITLEYARPWSWYSAQKCTYTIIIHEKYKFEDIKKQVPPYKLPGWRMN
jgi:Predicted secreted protein